MKKIRIFSILLVSILILSSVVLPNSEKAEAASATTYKSSSPEVGVKSDFSYTKQNDRIYLNKYIGSKTQLIIPDEIDGCPVFAIMSDTFQTSELTYLKLPASVKLIGNNAFNECDSLTRIDVDENNASFCSIDGVVYNKNKTTLKAFPAGRGGDFIIPNGVTTIAHFAFYRCYQLESVNMYNTVTTIGERAFSFCWNLKSIRFSDNLKSVGPFSFSHCDDLTELHLPKSLTEIGNDAFLGRINSNDSSKEYYLVDGVYCVKGSYAANYIKRIGLSYIIEGRTFTDVDAGITVTDLNNSVNGEKLELNVDIKPLSSIQEDFSNIKYTDGFVLDIYLTTSNGILVPNAAFKINFDNFSEDLIPTATKVFSSRVGDVEMLTNQLSNSSASYETDTLGTYIVLLSNDFSLKGDVNGDGIITLTDARLALLASANLIELTAEQKTACDVEATGADKNVITTADARRLLRTAAGLKN